MEETLKYVRCNLEKKWHHFQSLLQNVGKIAILRNKKENTSWHNIVVFNEGLVDVIEKYIKKGSKIYVEGELSTRKYQDKDGNDKYTTEVVLQGYNSTLTMLDSRNSGSASIEEAPNSSSLDSKLEDTLDSKVSGSQDLDDDIPF